MRLETRLRWFDIETPVWYRATGEPWRQGRTRAIADKGVIIRSAAHAEVGHSVEMIVVLSDGGCLVGRGRVVRAYPGGGPQACGDLPVAMDGFILTRAERLLDQLRLPSRRGRVVARTAVRTAVSSRLTAVPPA